MENLLTVKVNSNLSDKLSEKKFSIQFLPKCLFPISTTNKILYKETNLKCSYLIDIVHGLILKYYFKKENSFNLSSVVLKEKYGHLYNYYIDYLVYNEIIYLTKKHKKGKNARIYKLNDHILKEPIFRFKNTDTVLLKKYKKSINYLDFKEERNNLIEIQVKNKLIDDLFSVEIDYDKSVSFLDSTIQELDVYQKNIYSVESIKNKHIFYHFDNYGRLHTNFTILKSFIRKNCLLIDGVETSEIDIPNSQPLFLLKIMNESSNDVDYEEKKFYQILTKDGTFYKFLQNNYQSKDRNSIKEITYKVLFGRNYKNKTESVFEQIFPTIYGFIKKYKKERKDYKSLSYQLQKYESDFIFNKVIKYIMIHHPEIKLISCHDSIICKKTDKQIVYEIFKSHLKDEFEINI